MKTNLLVVDIDGTLAKTEKKHEKAFLETMLHFGFKDVNTDWASYAHYTDSHILKVNYEKSLKRDFNEAFTERFENIMLEKLDALKPFQEVKGASKVLRHISNKTNYAVAFVTGSLCKPAIYKLKQIGVPFNDALVSCSNNNIIQRKYIVTSAIQKAKLLFDVETFNKIIFVGDGIWDLQTAENLGLYFAGIGEEYQDKFKAKGVYHSKDWTAFDISEVEKKVFSNKASTA